MAKIATLFWGLQGVQAIIIKPDSRENLSVLPRVFGVKEIIGTHSGTKLATLL